MSQQQPHQQQQQQPGAAEPMEADDDAAPPHNAGHQQQQQQQQPAAAPGAEPEALEAWPVQGAALVHEFLAEFQEEEDEDEGGAFLDSDEDVDEEDLDEWEDGEDAMDENPFGLAEGSGDEMDEEDMEDLFDFEDEEEEEEHLTVKQRVQLECGLLHHDASLLLADEPSRHPGVKSAAHHHQTADALTYLPSPAPPGDVGATAAAAAAAAAATAAGEGATHAPDAADASAAADGADSGVVPGVGGDLGAEDVVVSCKGTLSIYRLSAGQPAKLMARHTTIFRHYSVSSSACGNYVAATGNYGLLSLFRVQRSSSSSSANTVATTSAAAATVAAAAAGAAGDDGEDDVAGLEWSLVHVATLLCKNSDELMVNSVRFGHFAGRLRMLVAHQDGMLYLFNLPDPEQPADHVQHKPGGSTSRSREAAALPSTAAATTGATAAAAAAARAAAVSRAGEAAALMVSDVPNWEPLGSQINRMYVEQLMALLPPAAQPPAAAGAAAAAAAGMSVSQQQQEEQETMSAPPHSPPAAAAAAAADTKRLPQYPEVIPALTQALYLGRNVNQPAEAPAPAGSITQAIKRAEQLLAVLLFWMRDNGRCGPSIERFMPLATAIALQQGTRIKPLAAGDAAAAHGSNRTSSMPTQPQPPPLFSNAAQQQQPQQHVQQQTLSERQQQTLQQQTLQQQTLQQQTQQEHYHTQQQHMQQLMQPMLRYGSWDAQAEAVGQLLQDERCLQELRVMERDRLSFDSSEEWVRQAGKMEAMHSWAQTVDNLRAAAAGQWALLGALGEQQREQQWQRYQSEDSGSDRDAATARAVYMLLLLRLLGPIAVPSIKQGARVVVLRQGPQQQAAQTRLTAAEVSAAPRLTTCAITGIAKDDKAALAAQSALAAAQADLDTLLAAPDGAVAPEIQGAAAIALDDAARFAAQDYLLPLNIAEASPDGQWLALGSDQLAVVLLPAGARYQHQVCHVLDLCPTVGPRPSTAWHMHQGTLGVQYMSFNSSSTLLAASSDAMRLVVVWSVAGPSLGQRIASFSLHNRDVLPVRFMPPAHPLTTLRQGLQQAAAAAAGVGQLTTGSSSAAAAAAAAARALQLQAGPGAAAAVRCGSAAGVFDVAAAGVQGVGVGGVGVLCHQPPRDRLLAYCELFGGLHVADMSVFTPASQSCRPACPSSSSSSTHTSPISSHFCLKWYLELSPKRSVTFTPEQPRVDSSETEEEAAAAAAAAAAAGDDDDDDQQGVNAVQQQQQTAAEAGPPQQQEAADAMMVDAAPPGPSTASGAAAAADGDGDAADVEQQQQQAPRTVTVYAYNKAPRINGLAVTPQGRLLVAVPNELLEWQLITHWSHTNHARFPPAFKAAVRTLVLAAAQQQHQPPQLEDSSSTNSSSTNSGSSSSSQQQSLLLSQLPGPVLEQVVGAAAVPQACWATVAVPTYKKLSETLEKRPRAPDGHVSLGMEMFIGGGPGQLM